MTTNLKEERCKYVDYLCKHVLGPFDGEEEQLKDTKKLRDQPHFRYILGTLFPQDSDKDSAGDQNSDESTTASDSGDIDDSPMSAVFQKLPASIGLSFYIENSSKIKISIWGAKYDREDIIGLDRKEKDSKKKSNKVWQRRSIYSKENPEIIEINKEFKDQDVLDKKAKLYATWRNIGKGFLVTINLVNTVKINEEAKVNSSQCLFQVGFKCESVDGEIKEYRNASRLSFDEEEDELALQYSKNIQYAIGHGCSASWDVSEERKYVQTEWIPQYIIKDFKFDLEGQIKNEEFLSLKYLASTKTKKDSIIKNFNLFLDTYKKWHEELKNKKCDIRFKAAKVRILRKIEISLNRIEDGIKLLKKDAKVFSSFKLANEAMLRQMVYSEQKATSINIKENRPDFFNFDFKMGGKWRPFQLAFQLMAIESLVNENSNFRDTVDLIWFPTGGGKTESYLALAAFELIYRRVKYGTRGYGTGVIKRYTLRLLTTQQFQRASTLICAMEIMRRDKEDILLAEPFSLGLWVGQNASPNKFTDEFNSGAKEKYDESLLEEQPTNYFQLLNCPICNTKIYPEYRDDDEKKYGVTATESSFKFFCPSKECELHDKIPVSVVDEEIYKNPPSFLIGTIDKFARLAWDHNASKLFGDEKTRPPYLIIQDELHLISGPLGTIAGIYEAALSTVIKSKESVEPKYIAATATIRRSSEQSRKLYGKNVNVFPSAGISYNDSFFARVDEKSVGRLYVGIMSQGLISPVDTLSHIASGLSQATEDSGLQNSDLKDAYWTQVIYNNSNRELGKTERLCHDDIPAKIKTLAKVTDKRRTLENIVQLSGRIEGHKIPTVLSRLQENMKSKDMIDILPCTNMISVGVDVPRLGLMLINGQPKTTSEYIQASSRIGRSQKKPGIVVTNYRPTMPRDRSHYENFVSYHNSIYRYVEPTSVTPFSPPAMERALHAALIIVMRHAGGLKEPESVTKFDPNDKKQKSLIDLFYKRIEKAATKDSGLAKKYLDKLIIDWERFINDVHDPKVFFVKGDQYNSFMIRYEDKHKNTKDYKVFATLNSMRNVDQEAAIEIRYGKPPK